MDAFLNPRWLLLPCTLLAFTLAQAGAHALEARDNSNTTSIPAPIPIHPDQNWDGIDGEWSSFTLRIGTPEQYVRALLSTASYQVWAVIPEGCTAAADEKECAKARGGIWNQSASTSFDRIGIYDLWIGRNLGYKGNAVYGYDTVGLGFEGEGGPTLQNTTVGGMAWNDYYLGVFGVNPKPTNFTDFSDGSPSYITLLKERKQIPSVSFGYTSGAKYRGATGTLASLTLGGYDDSKFVDNDVTFIFGSDNERDLIVVIQDITTPSQVESSPIATKLLPSPVYAYIDSTVPGLWLPVEACRAFEIEFGLKFDNDTSLYLVNDTLHDSLLERDANVTFSLGQQISGGSTIDITLPYAAFDLTAKAPFSNLTDTSRYFPLFRAQNNTQYTLGRTFLQEAYISVDWESARFNVSQVSWDTTAQRHLVPILPTTESGNNSDSPGNNDDSSGALSVGAIAGVAVGGVATIAILAIVLIFYFRRKRQAAARAFENEKIGDDSSTVGPTSIGRRRSGYRKAELEGSSVPTHSDHKRLLSTSNSLPGTPQSGHAPSSPGYFMTSAGVSTPTSPSGGEGTHSSSQSGAMFSPLSATASEADSRERHVFELPGDMPAIREKDGRALSEKEAIQHREKMYNGVASTPTATEQSFEGSRQPRRIDPEDVVRADGTSHQRFSFEVDSSESAGRGLNE